MDWVCRRNEGRFCRGRGDVGIAPYGVSVECEGRRPKRCVEGDNFPKLESCYFCDEGWGYTGTSERRAGRFDLSKSGSRGVAGFPAVSDSLS